MSWDWAPAGRDYGLVGLHLYFCPPPQKKFLCTPLGLFYEIHKGGPILADVQCVQVRVCALGSYVFRYRTIYNTYVIDIIYTYVLYILYVYYRSMSSAHLRCA